MQQSQEAGASFNATFVSNRQPQTLQPRSSYSDTYQIVVV